jgi:hypothetical protein
MKSSEFIESRLVNWTNSADSSKQVKNNRYHYMLSFREDIGWEWLYTQVDKCSADVGKSLEIWKIRPGDSASFVLEVREVGRREGIDDKQNSLHDFE